MPFLYKTEGVLHCSSNTEREKRRIPDVTLEIRACLTPLINTQSSYHWMNFGMLWLKVRQDESPSVPLCSGVQLTTLARNDTESHSYEITKGPTAKNCHSTESVKWLKRNCEQRAFDLSPRVALFLLWRHRSMYYINNEGFIEAVCPVAKDKEQVQHL